MSKDTVETIHADYYERFFQCALDLFCVCTMSGSFKEVNNAWTELLGFSREDLLNKSVIDFLHEEDRPLAYEKLKRLQEGHLSSATDNRFIHKDGSFRWLRWRGIVDAKSDLIFATAVDITKEKNTFDKLMEARMSAEVQSQLMMDIFSQAPCLAAVSTGPEHTFIYTNEAYKKFVGQRELIGKPVAEAIPDLDPAILQILDHVYQSGERFLGNDVRMTGDWLANGHVTEKFFTLVYAPRLDSNGKPIGLWTLAFDVTQQKHLENLVQITERVTALGRMAAGVAHEINNPLAYVLASLSILNKKIQAICTDHPEILKDNLLRMIEKSEAAVHRIRDIVKSLNSLSLDTKADKVTAISIEEVVTSAFEYAKSESCKDATFKADVEDGLVVVATKGGLIQVFLNLFINACHAISHGMNEVNEIKVTAHAISNSTAAIKIKDTGAGILKSELDKIFDPFYTSKRVGEGSGLGLSICHGIIKSLGGEITVKSEVGKGTEFEITLPLARPETAYTEPKASV